MASAWNCRRPRPLTRLPVLCTFLRPPPAAFYPLIRRALVLFELSEMRVCVVGAGASGLPSIKACKEQLLDVVCYEATADIGGLWNYRPEQRLVCFLFFLAVFRREAPS